MMNFEELGLRPELLKAVEKLGFVEPMPIQEQVIPYMLNENADLVGLAQTGTGKTAAFGLPILNMIDVNEKKIQALVLSPTRELCIQIANDLKHYAEFIPQIKVVPVYGGENIVTQFKELDVTPQILVATPGRLIDLIERKKVSLSEIRYLVLDEADEMLNMGFIEDIETILQGVPEDRRTLLFSATMPAEIADIAKRYMKNYHEISVGIRNSGAENVEHFYYMVKAQNRYLALKRIVDINPDIYGIVFCRTRQETKEVADKLMQDGYNADALHGDLSQAQRDYVMNRFRIHNLQLLVATDVAARGLDVSDLTHIINYNLPDENEVYIHRSGRTGRAGKQGVSISIIHIKELHKIKALEKITKKQFTRLMVPNGLEICKKQLFHLIDKMENVQVNDEQIDVFLPHIYKKLGYLTKEDIINRFVSLEFNRFLDYYKDAQDINIEDRPSRNKRSKDDRNNRNDDDRRSKSNDSRRDDNYKENRNSRRGRSDDGDYPERGTKVRMKINFGGSSDKVTPKNLLGLINSTTDDRSISITNIEISDKFSFFDVYADQAYKLIDAFESQPRKGYYVDLVNNDKQYGKKQKREKQEYDKRAEHKRKERKKSDKNKGKRRSGRRSDKK
ncbi:MAG: DEAD/DEAH box helicase [Bacteroidales bacterium]|nr:DEAD/DEAH box helicase [Bacteroidales bacterium]